MNQCSHAYRSVMYWGQIFFAENFEEKKHGFYVLLNQLEKNPEYVKKRLLKKEQVHLNTYIMRLDIKLLTGRQNV